MANRAACVARRRFDCGATVGLDVVWDGGLTVGESKQTSGYDRLARPYRWLEFLVFQGQLWRARVALVGSIKKQLPDSPQVLVLGDGDGRLLSHLCKALPTATFTSVEQSEGMIQLQKSRVEHVGASARVRFIHQNAANFSKKNRDQLAVFDNHPTRSQPHWNAPYDLLVMAFFSDCFPAETLSRCLPSWLAMIKENGLFYWVDFVQPRSGWRYYLAKPYLDAMHVFFRFTTGLVNKRLVDIDAIVAKESLRLLASENRKDGLIAAKLYRKMES